MTEAFIQLCEEIVERDIDQKCRAFISRVQDIMEGKKHPDWRTAEALVKATNQAMKQEAPAVAEQYYFYMHYPGEYKSNDYTIDAIPEPQEEQE